MAAGGSRSSETEGDLLVFEEGVFQKDTEEDQRSFGQDKAPPQKRRAVTRVESAETQDYVSAPPLTSCVEQTMEGGGRGRNGGAELRAECSQRATLGPAHM